MRGISWLCANQLAAEEGLCTMQWVTKSFKRRADFGKRRQRLSHTSCLSDWQMQRSSYVSPCGQICGPGTKTGNSTPDYGAAVYILLLQSNRYDQVSSILRNYYFNSYTCTNAWHILSSIAKWLPSSGSGCFERRHLSSCSRIEVYEETLKMMAKHSLETSGTTEGHVVAPFHHTAVISSIPVCSRLPFNQTNGRSGTFDQTEDAVTPIWSTGEAWYFIRDPVRFSDQQYTGCSVNFFLSSSWSTELAMTTAPLSDTLLTDNLNAKTLPDYTTSDLQRDVSEKFWIVSNIIYNYININSY